MSFLSQGDYMFPFEAGLYWAKHFFTWSFQTGAANPDGIIRFPSRVLNFIIFELFGNLGVSYFYIFSSLLIFFVAFYIFAKYFLNVDRRSTRIVAALFFALNPIFLGYLAKIGLLVGVAMLPLSLVALKYGFMRQQFRYFILYILLLNISLIHPFTFTVNLVVSAGYAFYMLRGQKGFIKKHWLKIIGLAVFGVMLYAYFLLPLTALGSVSRPEALAEEINDIPIDHTSLVDFANARTPLIALSLSKDVFLDFGYYNAAYQPVYMAAAFVFYLVIFGLYVRDERLLSKRQRSLMALLLGGFITLQLLSMAVFFDINRLIKWLITLPGGWTFRSPLKWQLYIPLVLGTMLCVLLENTPTKKIRRTAATVVVVTIALMGLFLSFDVYRLLLKPRQLDSLSAMQSLNLDHKNMLFINNDSCFAFLQENLRLVGEFNQIMISNNVQLKRIKAARADTVNLGAYDYIFGCGSAVAQPLSGEDRFKRVATFMDGTLELYQNRDPKPYIYATDTVFALDKSVSLKDKYHFVTEQLRRPFDFVTDFSDQPIYGLQDPFEALTPKNIQDDKILTKLWPLQDQRKLLVIHPNITPLFSKVEPDRLTFSPRSEDGMTPILEREISLNVAGGQGLEFAYMRPGRQVRHNLIPNASLEQGLWQSRVWDCYDYDDFPAVSMRLNDKEAADGRKSLELESQRHVACSGPPDIAVKDSARYLLSFRYKGTHASYRISFDDPRRTSLSDQLSPGNDWREFTVQVEVPKHARRMSLKVQAVPSNSKSTPVLYDDFSLVEIPDLQSRFYLVSSPDPSTEPEKPKHVRFETIDPTKKRVQIKQAKKGFYLAMRDTFHPRWQARLNGPSGILGGGKHTVGEDDHLKLNGFMNGWYIDPAELCSQDATGCTRAADGSYDLDLIIEFTPQRWFYLGLVISGVSAAGVVGYFVFLGVRRYRQGNGRYWRA